MAKGDKENEREVFAVALDLSEKPPETVDLGARFELVVAVETAADRDPVGARWEVRDGEAIVGEGVLPALIRHDPKSDDYDPRNQPIDLRPIARLAIEAPKTLGSFAWTLVFPAQEIAGVAYAAASLPFAFGTGEHRTSLAAWDVPSPVVAGETFRVKIGAKCSANCDLRGLSVEVRDETGAVIGRTPLGEEHWPGTQGLHWTELDGVAPTETGLKQFTVAFAAEGLGLPHRGASTSFSFMATPPAPHEVRVTVVDRDSGAPLPEAQVRFGHARAETDECGVARLMSPPGEQRLFVWKAGYAFPEESVEVAGDMELRAEGEALPEEDPYARWTG